LSSNTPDTIPYLTRNSGCGGHIRKSPDDFQVEEIPLYEPCGEGEFLYLTVEKRNLSTPDLISRIAHTLDIPLGDIGVAGLKDRIAVTRQTVCVPARNVDNPAQIELTPELSAAPEADTQYIRVLDAKQHTNKLKTGHLSGNRFSIVLRDLTENGEELAAQTLAQIQQSGFPNFYGEQRFGYSNTTDEPGFKLLRGEPTKRFSKQQLRLALSAAQSRLFNNWLCSRLADKLLHTVIDGDVMQVCASGGCFTVEDVAAEQARLDSRETAITGPIFGPKMRFPERAAGDRESEILAPFNVSLDDFSRFKKLTSGTRRRAIVFVDDLLIEPVEDGLRFQFTLPAGTYATTLLREFQKHDGV
jgi:tRNA pseudouridine13 synthase